MSRSIHIRGARTHNLRDVSLALPRGAWTVVCGRSGSGKSSLVLDTLAAESKRRYLGTLRRAAGGLDWLPRPDVDGIDGLPPAVASGFRGRRPSIRQTLSTVSELARGLQVLYARLGEAHCPVCNEALPSLDAAAMRDSLLGLPEKTRVLMLVHPESRGAAAREEAVARGFVRLRRADGTIVRVEDAPDLADDERVAWVLDRLVIKPEARDRIAGSIDQALGLGNGRFVAAIQEPGAEQFTDRGLSTAPYCNTHDLALPRLEPGLFSFNNPRGACPTCGGRGVKPIAKGKGKTSKKAATPGPCPDCDGSRLRPEAGAVRLGDLTLPALLDLPLSDLQTWLEGLNPEGAVAQLSAPVIDDLLVRVQFLCDVGLGYLAPGRAASTLSHGELRRAELAATCAARMSGLLFVLDEPAAGLHPVDRPALADRMRALVTDGNTLVVVDHDPTLAQRADHVVALGPGAGSDGGRVIVDAPVSDAQDDATLSAALGWDRPWPTPRDEPQRTGDTIVLKGARLRTLQGFDATLRTEALNAVVGVSGAGKSTWALDVLAPVAAAAVNRQPHPRALAGGIEGLETLERVVVAQGRAVRHPRATAGSLLGVVAPIRNLFAATLEARARGWGPSWFSTNVTGGRCETCEGVGERTIRLPDLPAMRVPCDVCEGRRFRAEIRAVRWRGLAIHDVLAQPIDDAATLFRDVPRAHGALSAARDVGLGYIPLGESSRALSTGELLRLRLAAALGKGRASRTLYVLDEPATGLHPDDVANLLAVLQRLTEAGHTVVVVEHDPQFVAGADHLIELGPGPGEAGGRLLYEGPPAGLLDVDASPTGRWFRENA